MQRVYMFQSQFSPLVENGDKRHTIRAHRKRQTQPGDELSLRVWSDKPYRSPQRIIRHAVCSWACEIEITELSPVILGYCPMYSDIPGGFDPDILAHRDGFKDWPAMRDWFRNTHGLPFTGDFIGWEV